MLMFDSHSDLFMRCHEAVQHGYENYILNTHLDNIHEGGFCGSICVLYVGTSRVAKEDWAKETWSIMGSISQTIREVEASGKVVIAKTYAEMLKAIDDKKYFIMLGLEGASGIGKDINQLETLYRLGIRHCGLTWNEENELATGVGSPNTGRGLTEAGIAAVKKINELGMLMDVSHLNEKSFWDLMKVAKGPVIASHSNSKVLCGHRRNLTDEQAIAIAKTGGYIGMNVEGEFVADKNPTVVEFVDHMDYFKKLIGIEHVALGFDYCNFLSALREDSEEGQTKGIMYIKDAHYTLDEMRRRGYTEEEIELVARGNMLRVIKEVVG